MIINCSTNLAHNKKMNVYEMLPKKQFANIFFVFLLFLLFPTKIFSEAESNIILGVEVDSSSPYLPVKVKAEKKLEFRVFTLKNPERIVFDFYNCKLSGKELKISVNKRTIENIRVAQNQLSPDIVRLVVDLKAQTYFRFEDRGNELLILFMLVLKGITLKTSDNSAVVYIEGVSMQSEVREEKVDFPPRMVFDIKETVLEKNIQQQISCGKGGFTGIRVAQFSVSPYIVRVVFDVKVYLKHEIKRDFEKDLLIIEVKFPAVYKKKIVVDAGHGGKDPGAISVYGDFEKDINLKVALYLRDFLLSVGADVKMTRQEDIFLPLEERTRIANSERAEVFISIHSNASELEKCRGVETYYFGEAGKKLCACIHPHLLNSLQLLDNGVKRAKFLVLRHTSMPAALVELGYLTNKKDAELLKKENFLKNCAIGIYNGLESYFGGSYSFISPIKITQDVITDFNELKKLEISEEEIETEYTNQKLPPDLEVEK